MKAPTIKKIKFKKGAPLKAVHSMGNNNPSCTPQSARAQQYIKVSARVRPLLAKENTEEKILEILKKDDSFEPLRQDVIKLKTSQAAFNGGYKYFEFERIMCENTNQQDVYDQCQIENMCKHFLSKGQNCNLMVYGPTNSGKTYTMQGSI